MLKSVFSKFFTSMMVFFCASIAHANSPRVVTSIWPVHTLTSAVMQGIGTPQLLIDGAQSPHHFSLRPSQAKALEKADAVFFVSESLENSLAPMFANLGPQVRVVELANKDGMSLLPIRASFDHHDDDHRASFDPHIWLSPDNAMFMLKAIAETLARLDPDNRLAYQHNTARAIDGIRQSATNARNQLRPYLATPYVVFHDAYHYFEHYFGLQAAHAITDMPEHGFSGKRLAEVRSFVKSKQVACLFVEPQFSSTAIENLANDLGARIGRLDPLGSTLAPGTVDYSALLTQLAANIATCLGGPNDP